jgi:hypothetical protein
MTYGLPTREKPISGSITVAPAGVLSPSSRRKTATCLGAIGVEIMLAHVAGHPLQAHRMIPLLQVSSDPETIQKHADDLDVLLEENLSSWAE